MRACMPCDIRPANAEDAIRVEFFGEEIERIQRYDPLTGNTIETLPAITIFPGKQFVTQGDKMMAAMKTIRMELRERIQEFEKENIKKEDKETSTEIVKTIQRCEIESNET